MDEVVKELMRQKKTISTMESCTGGGVCNAITNVEGASNVFKFSAVTYSNEFKIKMGVSSDVIEKYSVYSKEVAKEMSKNISLFTNSNYGIGITGKMNKKDEENLFGDDHIVFVSIYDKDKDSFLVRTVELEKTNRKENKENIIKVVEEMMFSILGL